MNDTLEKYFTEKVMSPVAEWKREASTNKAFYLGEKEFEYVVTLTGDEPTVNYPRE